jgi:hypothetical protein
MAQVSDIITTIIAIYGAFLATVSFILSLILGISKLRKEYPKVKVKFSFGTIIDQDGKKSESLILFDAHNKREVPVIITGCGWLAQKGYKFQFINLYLLNLPQQLDAHRKITAYYACRWFREFKDKDKIIGFYFIDEEGHMWIVKVSNKQKQAWENAKNDGYLIEWDEKRNIYYRRK